MINNSRKSILIFIIGLLLLITIINVPKLFLNKKEEILPEVKLKEIEKSKSFAIMVPNGKGNGYISYNKNEWPKDEDDYYYVKSECIDNNGNKVENAITYNEENNTASLTTNSTVYCTLYFDKYNYMYVPTHDVPYNNSTVSAPIYMSSKVKKVEFVNNIDTNKATEQWDITDTTKSPAGSVKAWVEPIDTSYDTLYIGSKSKIRVIDLRRAFTMDKFENNTTNPITNLESVNFDNMLDTSKTSSLEYLFLYNTNLKEVNGAENWNTSQITNMIGIFAHCKSISNENLKFLRNWRVSNVLSLFDAFIDCTNLTNLDFLSNWDISSLISAQSIFYSCTNLKDISALQNWNVSNVTSTYLMLSGTAISDISPIQNWNVSNVDIMRSMFRNCTNIENVNLSNWSASEVTNMQEMFNGCTNLQNVNLSTWDTSKVTNVFMMFYNCTNLQTIDMSNATFTQIQDINNYQNMFNGVPESATITVKKGQKDWIQNTAEFKGTVTEI